MIPDEWGRMASEGGIRNWLGLFHIGLGILTILVSMAGLGIIIALFFMSGAALPILKLIFPAGAFLTAGVVLIISGHLTSEKAQERLFGASTGRIFLLYTFTWIIYGGLITVGFGLQTIS